MAALSGADVEERACYSQLSLAAIIVVMIRKFNDLVALVVGKKALCNQRLFACKSRLEWVLWGLPDQTQSVQN